MQNAIKLNQIILNKYELDLTAEDLKKIQIKFENQDVSSLLSKRRTIKLMKDEYNFKDIQFEESKKVFRKDLQGPSLKHLSKMNLQKISKQN